MGDGTVELAVHFVVGIQQIEGHTTYIHSPYIGMYVIVQIRNIDNHLIAVLVQYTFNGQLAEVLSLVVGNLLAVHRQRLGKITVTVEETYTTQVNVAV